MEILIAPISGSLFPAQVCSLIKLCENNYKPEICFVGSGGSVATYIGKASYWNPSKIRCVCTSISAKIFISEWASSFINIFPTSLFAIANGSFYKTTDEAKNVLKEHLSPSTIVDVEIWVAAVNSTTGRVLLSCNRNRNDSIIKGENLNVQIHDYEKLQYLNGNVDDISTSILASACIPIMIAPVEIKGEKYVDCGLEYGSSFTPMYLEILKISREKKVHLIYITGCDLSNPPLGKNKDPKFFDNVEAFTSHASRSFVRQDRNAAYSIVVDNCKGEEPWYKEFNGCDLPYILEKRKDSDCSLIEIFPKKVIDMDLTTFTGKDVNRIVEEYSSLLKIRVWWSGEEEVF